MIDSIAVPVGVVFCALGLAGLAGGTISALSWRLRRSEAEVRRLRDTFVVLAREERRNRRDIHKIRREQLRGQESAPGSKPITPQVVDEVPPPQPRPGTAGFWCKAQHNDPNNIFQNAKVHWHPLPRGRQ